MHAPRLAGGVLVRGVPAVNVARRASPLRYKELEKYILQRRDELTGRAGTPAGADAEPASSGGKGFA